MVVGMVFTASYIINVTYLGGSAWFFGITTWGIGAIGMFLNFGISLTVSRFTKAPPEKIQDLVASVRVPRGSGLTTHVTV